MKTTIGSTTTERGAWRAGGEPTRRAAMVHSMGPGIMASITALSRVLGMPTLDVSTLNDEQMLAALQPYRSVLFQGWNPRFSGVAKRIPPGKRLFAHWHTGISGVEAMGEGQILADALACDRLEALLWTHPEFRERRHPRIISFPNVAIREQFNWLLDAPGMDLDPNRFQVLLPTVNRPVKNGLTASFAASLASIELPLALHVTHAFGNGKRCGELLRHLFGERLTVHPALPVRAPRWGSIIKSVDLSVPLSFSESYCYALIESLVAGVPVVVSEAVPMAYQFTAEKDIAWTVVSPHDVCATSAAIARFGRLTPSGRAAIAVRQLEAFRRFNRDCAAELMLRCAELELVDGRSASRSLAELI